MMVWMISLQQQQQQQRGTCGLLSISSLADLKVSLARTVREELRRSVVVEDNNHSELPTIYVITPTYPRPEQIPELTRLAQTLMNVPNIYWLVTDDTDTPNQDLIDYLTFTGIPHTYLNTPMPPKYSGHKVKPKGVANRNAGMEWLRQHASKGVFYFADDDNTYDIRLFQEMRYTEKVSMWPVGLVSKEGLSTPVVSEGKFQGWFEGWIGGRTFPVDMAGFAVSVQYLLEVPNAAMPYKPGHEEDGFLRSLHISPYDIEFKAEQCTKVYVWHTQTKKSRHQPDIIFKKKYDNTNIRVLQELLRFQPKEST
ncbi:hypothetical protein Pmani_013748 [Petrolisthes manimaculis]|uniref:Galactosylgalactosylxylosylprotein 3-beta-glucuronosyltransferase n=1 Tax=Petrolisthes manimaculis TaxID=1843537 RepID=A0AAE1PXT1_9EUCA|nr:hypothetical protein Pmani_013748 [Petrolisthes manimaculis]